MRSRLVGVCLVGALSFVFACSHAASSGSGGAAIGSTSEAIQGGTSDGADHPYAVGVCIGNKGQCEGICSGALILPNLVVTARHCVQNTTEQISCGVSTFSGSLPTNYITTNQSMYQTTSGWHPVQQVVTPTDTGVCGNDLALLILGDLVPSSEATPVIPGVQYPMGDLDLYEHLYTAIGYGRVSEVDPGNCVGNTATCPGYRRIKNGINVLCIPGDQFIDCPAITDPNGNSAYTSNEFLGDEGVCAGDSGSSAYEQSSFLKGTPVTFGVLSRGGADQNDATKCGESFYTRLDKYRDLVVQTAETASASWTLYPKPTPDWTVFVAPPTTADGGTTDAAPKGPTNLGDGATCTTSDECASGLVCEDTGTDAGLSCTAACDPSATNACTGGYVCGPNGYCVGSLPTTPTTESTTTTGGCSTARFRPASSSTGMLALAAAVGLMLNVRRAARRRRDA